MVLSVVGALGAASAVAQEDQIGARGFAADKIYNTGDLDAVSLFNGNLTVSLPLGFSYPVGENLSYGFAAVYNSLVWELDEYPVFIDGVERMVTVPVLSDLWNAGAGWMVSPGRLYPPNAPPENPTDGNNRWLFVDSTGARHHFNTVLHPGVYDGTSDYSNDSTYLRMRVVSGAREIQFPDGSVTVFEDEAPGTAEDWRVTAMRDAFGNEVVVSRETSATNGSIPSGDVWELYSDPHGREQWLKFQPDPGIADDRLYEVDLEAFGGGRAVYELSYDVVNLERCYRNTDPNVPNNSEVAASLLAEVVLPDGTTYEMREGSSAAYSVGCGGGEDGLPGALQSLRLRTRGELQWDYGTYFMPRIVDPHDPIPTLAVDAKGVVERRQLDASGAVLGTWRYSSETIVESNSEQTVLTEGETRTYVVYPTGDCSKHYFRAFPGQERNYGLPFSEIEAVDDGLYLSTEVWDSYTDNSGSGLYEANFYCSGTEYRSTRVLYEDDGGGIGSDVNRRLKASRTTYHLDGGREADTTYSSFDGLGHYETTTTGGTFSSGNVRTETTDYALFVSSSVVGGVDLPNGGSPWILDTFARRDLTEGGQTERETYCFDGEGFMTRRRTYFDRTPPINPSPNDVIAEFEAWGGAGTPGDIRREFYYGGDVYYAGVVQSVGTGVDLCALGLPSTNRYNLDHWYQNGTRERTRYLDAGGSVELTLFSHEIDASTGLIASTEDPGGISTSFLYDDLGRLTRQQPEATHGARVNFNYTSATTGGQKARVDIFRRPNGGGDPVYAHERVVFDDLGRVFQENREVPTASGTILNLRETLYNGRGWKTSVSEQVADGASATQRTVFTEYDPFGRPGRITPPDGTAHDVVLDYTGVSEVARTLSIEVTSLFGEEPQTTTERYDRQGRLYQVLEPGALGVPVTTTYGYDAGNRLASVSMSDGTTTQERLFNYDGRGFLASEQHPEKGASGNGVVAYSGYDPRGHATRRIDGTTNGAGDLTFTYDRVERLIEVEETSGSQRVLKEFEYEISGSENGKLKTATRHNYLPAFGNADVEISEVYSYGTQGRVIRRDIERGGTAWFTQPFGWTELGDVASVTYPTCLIPDNSECTGGGNPSGQPSRTVSYTYTGGFLTGVTGYVDAITYHPNEMTDKIEHSNGVDDLWTLDPQAMRRPARIQTQNVSGTGFDTGTYAYDGAGNIKAIGLDTYAYDGVSRLLTATAQQGQVSETSEYDAFGNRVSAATYPLGSRPIPVDPETNRLEGTPHRAVSYDARGNQTQWGSATYAYDGFNQLTHLSDSSSGDDFSYVYTADEERIIVIDDDTPSETWYLRDLDGLVLREFFRTSVPAATTWLKDTVHRQGQVLATVGATSGTEHAHLDHLGTIRLWTDASGGSPTHHTYTAFGEEVADVLDGQAHRYTGHERDILRSMGCPSGLNQNETVDNTTLSVAALIEACDTISSENTSVTASGEVRFRAGDEIHLGPGFRVAAGTKFVAEIDASIDSAVQDLDYMHARYYSSGLGRALAVDPILRLSEAMVMPQRWNRYSYVANNPLKWVDSTGEYIALPMECRDGDCEELDLLQQALDDAGANVQLTVGKDGIVEAVGEDLEASDNETISLIAGLINDQTHGVDLAFTTTDLSDSSGASTVQLAPNLLGVRINPQQVREAIFAASPLSGGLRGLVVGGVGTPGPALVHELGHAAAFFAGFPFNEFRTRATSNDWALRYENFHRSMLQGPENFRRLSHD